MQKYWSSLGAPIEKGGDASLTFKGLKRGFSTSQGVQLVQEPLRELFQYILGYLAEYGNMTRENVLF